ncbi:hypothetical protein ES705_14520 [subsurface metagenome]
MEPSFDSLPTEIQGITIKLDRLEVILNEILKSKEKTVTWFSVPEVAEYLHLAIPTIYTMTSNHRIPFVRRGKKILFLKTAIDEWLSAGRKRVIADNDLI